MLRLLTQKLMVNSRQVLAFDLPRLGGSWIAAFFLTGLLVNLRRPGAARVRFFAIFCIAVLTIAQALAIGNSGMHPAVALVFFVIAMAPVALLILLLCSGPKPTVWEQME